jgi:hypothetical protein
MRFFLITATIYLLAMLTAVIAAYHALAPAFK